MFLYAVIFRPDNPEISRFRIWSCLILSSLCFSFVQPQSIWQSSQNEEALPETTVYTQEKRWG